MPPYRRCSWKHRMMISWENFNRQLLQDFPTIQTTETVVHLP
jgi:hypothetical protein